MNVCAYVFCCVFLLLANLLLASCRDVGRDEIAFRYFFVTHQGLFEITFYLDSSTLVSFTCIHCDLCLQAAE